MKFAQKIWLAILLTVLLGACNIGATPAPAQDVGAVQTQAYLEVMAQYSIQQTQTAQAVPPTPFPSSTPFPSPTLGALPTFAPVGGGGTPGVGTPFAFNTPAAGFTPFASLVATIGTATCLNSAFVGDITIPDGTVVKPGTNLQKAWSVQNTGTCDWGENFTFAYLGGVLGGYDIVIKKERDIVEPGEIKTFDVVLTAPKDEKVYEECWSMKDDRGYYFGQSPLPASRSKSGRSRSVQDQQQPWKSP